jgi:hypothetical protein
MQIIRIIVELVKLQLARLHYIDEITHEHIMRLGKLNQVMHTIQKRTNGMQTQNQLQITNEA